MSNSSLSSIDEDDDIKTPRIKEELNYPQKIKSEARQSKIKHESLDLNIYPVDMDNYGDGEAVLGSVKLKEEDGEEEGGDGGFEGYKKPDHSEVIHDIFGDSEEEEEFEGFNENELEKEGRVEEEENDEDEEEEGGVGGPRGVRGQFRDNKDNKESEDGRGEPREERCTDIMRAFEEIVEKQKIEKRINRPRKRDGVDYVNDMDDRIADLMNKMRMAAVEDEELYILGQPGIKKMQLLPTVRELLRQSNIKEILIESKFLVVMAVWLKPLPNHILPPLDIRILMLKSLLEFPTLSSDILKECNIGKAVMYLYKHPKETTDNKKIAGHLINEWSRPIFNLSSNYNGMTREDRLERDRAIVSKRKLVDNDASAKREVHDEERNGNEPWIPRATVPKPSTKDYIIRPNWRAGDSRRSNNNNNDDDDDDDDDGDNEEEEDGRQNLRSVSTDKKRQRMNNESSNKDLHLERTFRKIKEAGKKRKMIQRAANISIQGRGLGI